MTDTVISAQVILRPAGPIDAVGPPTSANVAAYAPPPRAVKAVQRFFGAAGFTVSPMIGISFAIAGPQSLFESVFGERPLLEGKPGLQTASTKAGYELSLDALPSKLRRSVDAVTFTPPPAFGPTSY